MRLQRQSIKDSEVRGKWYFNIVGKGAELLEQAEENYVKWDGILTAMDVLFTKTVYHQDSGFTTLMTTGSKLIGKL
ncbi:hypothetical protein ESCO47_00184 [Escherichia phage vB_EcoM_ESCO47]|nr:hypothetical protein ESCO47_00184 [Escherichia phage vB_EcoM_ESCO47]